MLLILIFCFQKEKINVFDSQKEKKKHPRLSSTEPPRGDPKHVYHPALSPHTLHALPLHTQRTSISVNIKERLDFSCAVFDSTGGLVANAPHLPVHLGAMQEAVRCVCVCVLGG